jgi:polyketide cyclase/dehydrase/lipid transport protein
VIQDDREIDVDQPAEVVFERLVRIENLPHWQPAIVEAALTSPEPIGVGSTARIVVAAAGQRTEAVATVTEFERPRLIALRATASSAEITARVEVVPSSAASCRVSINTTITLGGMLRFVEGMARSRIEAEAPIAATAAKKWLEAEP